MTPYGDRSRAALHLAGIKGKRRGALYRWQVWYARKSRRSAARQQAKRDIWREQQEGAPQ